MSLNTKYDVLIIGGGLAGLCNAIELSKAGLNVILVEKKSYPFHKVCGEYVSMEVAGYVKSLGFDPFEHGAKAMKRFQLSSIKGSSVFVDLPLGGFSISRYQFDLALYEIAQESGTTFVLEDEAQKVEHLEQGYEVSTKKGKSYQAELVIGAQGKRSIIDKNMKRAFFKEQTGYSGIKCHYEGDFPEDLVALHNFKGGYCGLSQVETGHVNVCYLVKTSKIKEFGGIDKMEKELLSQNPHLHPVFHQWKPVFEKKLAISQVYFKQKTIVEDGILMSGDAAGMIYPLAGNGMAMAIHAAKILSSLIKSYFKGDIDIKTLEQEYERSWKNHFSSRVNMGRLFQRFFGSPLVSSTAVGGMRLLPFLRKPVIKMTHGKPV
jgi:flavin-dependent dehydrogenase